MKLNNKYTYFKKYKRPLLKDFKSENDFKIALKLFEFLNSNISYFISITPLFENIKLKTTLRRIENIKLKVGEKVFIERFDKNGIPNTVEILSIKQNNNRAIIKCSKGYFVFSRWNCKNDNIKFNYNSNIKNLNNNYNRINGNNYYI